MKWPPTWWIFPPEIIDYLPPSRRTSLWELCAEAGIPMRVTSALTPEIRLSDGITHYLVVRPEAPDVLVVGTQGMPEGERAIRVLETLAHGFHLYEAKECVRGLFGVQSGHKKPPKN